MPYRKLPFVNNAYYHIYNRGVEKRQIFTSERDYQRFLQTLFYYQFEGLKFRFSHRNFPLNENFMQLPKKIEIICYCLMPNHFHLIVKQEMNMGVHKFMQRTLNSYTKYFNTKNKRIGPLLQGTFKAIPIETDEQLMHISRYIHVNPYVAGLTQNLETYSYSSYVHYVGIRKDFLCNSDPVLSLFKNSEAYKEFIMGHQDYAKELEMMKHLLIEEE